MRYILITIFTGLVGCSGLGGVAGNTSADNEEICIVFDRKAYRYNDFIVSHDGKNTVVVERPTYIDEYHRCSKKHNQDRLVENERLLIHRIGRYPVSKIIGSACAKEPTLLLDYHKPFIEVNESHRNWNKLNQFPPYDFYVQGKYTWAPDNYTKMNKVGRSLIEISAIIGKQCGTLPEVIHVVGRGTEQGEFDTYTGVYKSVPKDYYSGKFYPRSSQIELIHDDKAAAAFYEDYAERREIARIQQAEMKRLRSERAAIFLLLGLYSLWASSDCNDPNLPRSEKHWQCAY